MGDLGLIPGLGRFPGEGKGYPLQYSGLENSMDCIVHQVAKSWIQLSDFHFHFPIIQDKFLISQFLTLITSIKFHLHVVAQREKKKSTCNAGDQGSIPGSGSSPREGNGNRLQDSGLENSLSCGAWQATVHGWQRVRQDWATNTRFHTHNRFACFKDCVYKP